jgi:hypothetical protein
MVGMARRDVIEQVTAADITWYERSSRRLEEERPEDDANEVEAPFVDISVTVGIWPPTGEDDPPRVRVRERMNVFHQNVEFKYDAAVAFTMRPSFSVDDKSTVSNFVEVSPAMSLGPL